MASAGSVGRRGEGTPEPPPPPTPHAQPKLSPRTPDRASPYPKTGACFTCNQEGHWSRDCPSKKSAGRTQLAVHGGRVEAPECPCGAGPCVELISRTVMNPGRKFFRCPVISGNERCTFFQWCDSPSPHQLHVASPVKQSLNLGSPIEQQAGNTPQQGDWHPLCQCGAGWCIVSTVKEGKHAGRKYFSCPRKKSDEKCNFSQWCNEFNLSGKSMTRPINQDLVSPSHGTANIQYPNCTCGAGRCRLLTMELGEYAGRKYFGCPVKKGQGACNFFQWQNAPEGEHGKGNDLLVGSNNQHLALVTEEPKDRFNIKPTCLNFDNIEVGLPPTLERLQRDAGGLSNQNYRTSLHSSSSNVSPKPGKCYRCGKEGHWIADCVEYLPPAHR